MAKPTAFRTANVPFFIFSTFIGRMIAGDEFPGQPSSCGTHGIYSRRSFHRCLGDRGRREHGNADYPECAAVCGAHPLWAGASCLLRCDYKHGDQQRNREDRNLGIGCYGAAATATKRNSSRKPAAASQCNREVGGNGFGRSDRAGEGGGRQTALTGEHPAAIWRDLRRTAEVVPRT